VNTQVISADYFYFGKCPARGDFVRSTGQHAMLTILDEWITKALEHYSANQGDYASYDQMSGISFVFCNPKMAVALTGYLIASHDTSKRRFPLVTGCRIQIRQPEHFIAQAPLILDSLWHSAHNRNQQLMQLDDSVQLMQLLDQPLAINNEISSYQALIAGQSLWQFSNLLGLPPYNFVQSLIALGLLLQPVISQGGNKLNKILLLPLAPEPNMNFSATFWLDLIVGFIKRHNIELSIMLRNQDQPQLMVGFQGADIMALSGLMQNKTCSDHWVNIEDADWVDRYLENDAGLATLEQVLGDSQMSLTDAIKLFKQVFLGT
jgi:type VI secretion system protein ImpM